MDDKTAELYNEMTRTAAFRIVRLLSFEDMPEQYRQQAEQITMQRVHLMRAGDQSIVEGDGLVTELVETPPAPPAEPEPTATGSEPEPEAT